MRRHIVGGILVAVWAWGLVRDTSSMLLDRQAPNAILDSVRKAVETDDRFRVADLHIWSIGPGYRAAIIAVSATAPCTIEDVRAAVPKDIGDE